MYVYNAVVDRIYDGDTIRVSIDLGFSTWIRNTPIRLLGVNTPELRGEERSAGLKAKEYVESKIPPGTKIVIYTHKDKTGKYGRYLAVVMYDEGKNLNLELTELGLGVKY